MRQHHQLRRIFVEGEAKGSWKSSQRGTHQSPRETRADLPGSQQPTAVLGCTFGRTAACGAARGVRRVHNEESSGQELGGGCRVFGRRCGPGEWAGPAVLAGRELVGTRARSEGRGRAHSTIGVGALHERARVCSVLSEREGVWQAGGLHRWTTVRTCRMWCHAYGLQDMMGE